MPKGTAFFYWSGGMGFVADRDVGGDLIAGTVDGSQNVAIGKEINMHINDDSGRHDRDLLRQEATTDRLALRVDDHERRLVAHSAEISELRMMFAQWHRTTTPVNWTLVLYSILLAIMVAAGLVALGWVVR